MVHGGVGMGNEVWGQTPYGGCGTAWVALIRASVWATAPPGSGKTAA